VFPPDSPAFYLDIFGADRERDDCGLPAVIQYLDRFLRPVWTCPTHAQTHQESVTAVLDSDGTASLQNTVFLYNLLI
jgi:hypothetical protein